MSSLGESALPVKQEKYLAGLILENNKRTFYLIKGLLETALERIGIEKSRISYQKSNEKKLKCFNYLTNIIINNKTVGFFGEINKDLKNSLKIQEKVGFFEIELEVLEKFIIPVKKFNKISLYPSVVRDLALLVRKNILFDDLFEMIKNFHPLIVSVEPFDVFESDKLGIEVRNIAFRLVFQSFDRTLKSEEVDIIINKLIKIISDKFDVKLRNF